MTEGLTRRHALGAAMAGVAVPALAACGSDDGPSSTATDTETPTGGASSPSGPAVLAKTSDVPVGGATFLESPSIVVTQPAAGDFKAFTAPAPTRAARSRTSSTARSTAAATAASTP